MANTPRARGLKPVQDLSGGAWMGKATPYYMNANSGGAAGAAACGIGSVVAITGANDESGNGLRVVRTFNNGYMTAGEATATASIASIPVGVVVGFDLDPTNLNLAGTYRAISTARLVYVCDDPDALFEIQEDSNGAQGGLSPASVGLNATVTSETVSTTTGLSNIELDTSAVAATASFPLRILAFARRVDNEVSSSYAKVIVKFTRHANATLVADWTNTFNAGV